MIAHKTKAAMPGRLSHNALLKQGQITRLSAGGQTLSVSLTDSQISSVRQTYGHHNVLKLFQTGDSRSAFGGRNVLKNLQTPNPGFARNTRNHLTQLNYRESRESATTLIIPRGASGVIRLPAMQEIEETNNLVTDGYLVHGSSTNGGWEENEFLYHEENQQSPALGRNPDLAYAKVVPESHEVERVVTESYLVNRPSLSESDSLPSLRGSVTYKIFVGQRLRGTQRPAQNNPEIIGAVHSITGSNPVQPKKKGRISSQTLWLVGCRQTTENPAVNYGTLPYQSGYWISNKTALTIQYVECAVATKKIIAIASLQLPRSVLGITHPSGSALVFLRCSALSFRPHASSTHAEKLALGLSAFSRSKLASISSMSSCGKRIPTREDLLFLFPVATTYRLFDLSGESTPYIKKQINKILDVAAHRNVRWVHTLSTAKAQVRHKTAKPRGAPTPSGPLTTSVITSNEVAMSNRITPLTGRASRSPNLFLWRFLALNRHDKKARPCRLSVEAATEREARRILAPHFILSLAARLPVAEVRHA